MYWYYKYPMLLIGVLILLGLGYMVWERLPASSETEEMPTGIEIVTEDDEPVPGVQTPALRLPGQPGAAVLDARLQQQLDAAAKMLQAGNLSGARDAGLQIIAAPEVFEFDKAWYQAAELVSKTNTIILTSNAPAPEKVRYIVQPGDSLDRIARNYRTTVRSLQKQNRIDLDSSRIHPGQVMDIYQGDWSLVVVKSQFVLLLYDGQKLAKLYHVGIGRQDRTPVGTFRIINKQFEPAWTPPGRNIPFGHPDNVLGTRWLGIEAVGDTDPTLRGYGIHGTWQPETIGSAASEGCVRMKNDDVNELFDIVLIGTGVVIKE